MDADIYFENIGACIIHMPAMFDACGGKAQVIVHVLPRDRVKLDNDAPYIDYMVPIILCDAEHVKSRWYVSEDTWCNAHSKLSMFADGEPMKIRTPVFSLILGGKHT